MCPNSQDPSRLTATSVMSYKAVTASKPKQLPEAPRKGTAYRATKKLDKNNNDWHINNEHYNITHKFNQFTNNSTLITHNNTHHLTNTTHTTTNTINNNITKDIEDSTEVDTGIKGNTTGVSGVGIKGVATVGTGGVSCRVPNTVMEDKDFSVYSFNSNYSVTGSGPTNSTTVTDINTVTTTGTDITTSTEDIGTVGASTVTEIWNYKTILKYKFNKKLKILIKFNGILVFLTIILTTNNSLNYLLNYIISCFLYTCISLGTFIHFFFLPNSVTVTGPPNSNGPDTKATELSNTIGPSTVTKGKGALKVYN